MTFAVVVKVVNGGDVVVDGIDVVGDGVGIRSNGNAVVHNSLGVRVVVGVAVGVGIKFEGGVAAPMSLLLLWSVFEVVCTCRAC